MDRREEWKDYQYVKRAAKEIVALAKVKIKEVPPHGAMEKDMFAVYPTEEKIEEQKGIFKYPYLFYIAFRYYRKVENMNPDKRFMEAVVGSCGYVSGRVLCGGTVDDLQEYLYKDGFENELTEALWSGYQNLDNDENIH